MLDGSHGIGRTVGALVNRNRHRPIGRIEGIADLVDVVLDHLVGERLARFVRCKGQTAQNTGVRCTVGLRLIVGNGELALVLVRAQQRLELCS